MSNYREPYPSPQPFPTAPKKSSSKIVWIVLGIIGGIGLLGCGCCGVLFYLGIKVDAQQMAASVNNDPNVQRELGGIESCKMNWPETWAEESDIIYVYDVSGPQGSGKLIVEDDWGISSARLRTSQGEWDLEVTEIEY